MSGTLTPAQCRLLLMIDHHTKLHGSPPSYQKMGEVVGVRSRSTMHRRVDALVERGFLSRGKHAHRHTIEVLRLPPGVGAPTPDEMTEAANVIERAIVAYVGDAVVFWEAVDQLRALVKDHPDTVTAQAGCEGERDVRHSAP